ncbi:MAG: hypothetical protein AABY32_06420, partial [Nanoarchaeota archaeon]
GECKYEGSLWATFVLNTLENGASKKYDISKYMPYLITMMDETENQAYLPESFLYFLTGEFESELLSKQIFNEYWEVSENKYSRYYNTALALWPLYYPRDPESPLEKKYAKEWLLEDQEDTGKNSGCWNNGNIRDTAFILYSIWPKSSPNIYTECSSDSDCPQPFCGGALCEEGVCINYLSGCSMTKDGCCNVVGCTTANDKDCLPEENACTSAINCKGVLPEEKVYCSDDNTEVWKNDSKFICESNICDIKETPKKVKTCNSTSECYAGNCLSTEVIPDDECDTSYDCEFGKSCVGGVCILDELLDCENEGYSCMSQANCDGELLYDYSCTGIFDCCDTPITLGECVDDEGGEICTSDEECIGGTTPDVSDTALEETCCVYGTCEDITSTSICGTANDGICRTSCENDEEENSNYDCDYGESCCLAKEKSTSYLWIWILLILILLSALGIVFRDKLRIQLLKLKTLFGGKKDQRKFEMPSTSHPNPQERILPRRIFSSQSSAPIHRHFSPQHSLNKKPEEKPKNELDDVLKKLKEMGK